MEWFFKANEIFGFLLASIAFALVCSKMRWLNKGGIVTALGLASCVFFTLGLLWLLPLFYFMGSSILLGKMLKNRVISDTKAGKPRDALQVICNGGLYAILALALACGSGLSTLLQWAMMVSLAGATADTWASELGMGFRGKTYSILNFRPLPKGLSGAISWIGTVGGLLGACSLIGFTTWVTGLQLNLSQILFFGSFGFCIMLMDSVLGAFLQARYVDIFGQLSDIKAKERWLFSGFAWVTNDAVNLLSNLIGVLLFLAFCG